MLLRHNPWDIYTFLIIKYILGPEMLFESAIIINLDAMRYHGFVYANNITTKVLNEIIYY